MGPTAGRQDLCVGEEGIWQAAVKPVDQSPFLFFPPQWLITTTENEREGGRERKREEEIKGARDLGGRQLTPLTVGLPCILAFHLLF